MPGLDDSTADGYASFHAVLRATLLGAWCIYLVAPSTWKMTSTACYTWGAAMYFYFGQHEHDVRAHPEHMLFTLFFDGGYLRRATC